MQPLIVTAVFYLAVMLLCLVRSDAGRIFIGVFFLVMAFGVHGYFIVSNPQGYVDFANNFALDIYRDIAEPIVEFSPSGFGVLMMLFEATAGLLLLSTGRYVRLGLIAGVVFLVGIAPWGVVTMANLILAVSMVYLLTKEFEHSGLEPIRNLLAHPRREMNPS